MNSEDLPSTITNSRRRGATTFRKEDLSADETLYRLKMHIRVAGLEDDNETLTRRVAHLENQIRLLKGQDPEPCG